MGTNNNLIFMTINVYNPLETSEKDDEIIGKIDEDSGILTGNPDSSAFLLDYDDQDEQNGPRDLDDDSSSGVTCWVEEYSGEFQEENSEPPPKILHKSETFWSILTQVVVPFFLAGFGMVGAGLILDNVTSSQVFQDIPEIMILIPALLGLKGNIEMTLASRLSTEANLGRLETTRSKFKHILGNIYIVQFQGITVGLIASLSPYWMGTPPETLEHTLILCASSVAATSIVSFFLGVLMSTIVVLSSKHGINPDNVAAPLAASIGDIVTLTSLFIFSSIIYAYKEECPWLAPAILGFYMFSLPLWFWLAYQKAFSRKVIKAPSTWLPILGAMIISSFAGKIFEHFVKQFHNIAVLQPVMNGVGGNIVAVQTSRISTYLHCWVGGSLNSKRKMCSNPFRVFYQGPHYKSALALLMLLVPGHLVFLGLIWSVHDELSVSFVFVAIYLFSAIVQVVILLYLADILVPQFWRMGIDPDNAAVPCLTSTSDFLGTSLLVLAFEISLILQGTHTEEQAIVTYFKTMDFIPNSTLLFS